MNADLRKLAKSGMPFIVKTTTGTEYEVIHQDYISISPKDDGPVVIWDRNGEFNIINSLQIESATFANAS